MEGWMEGWMDGWKEAKAGLRIAYSNKKTGIIHHIKNLIVTLYHDKLIE